MMRISIGIDKMVNKGVTGDMNATQAKQLGRYLRQKRESQSISTRSLASAVGVDMAQIVRLEQGSVASPKAEILARIAATLNVPVADVLTTAGYPTTADLPSFTPYLRARYDLPDSAVVEMEQFFSRLAAKHGVEGPVGREDEQ
jgi:transcriptional regulator with XRE-family HTH domain